MAFNPDQPHFTAIVEIQHTQPAKREYKDSYDKTGYEVARRTTEISRIVLRSPSLELLAEQAAKHLALTVNTKDNA